MIKDGLITIETKYLNNINSQQDILNKLLPQIYALDFCIPGPHPGWENDAKTIAQNITSKYPGTLDEFSDFSVFLQENYGSNAASGVGGQVKSLANEVALHTIVDPGGYFVKPLAAEKEAEYYKAANREVLAFVLGLNAREDQAIESRAKVVRIINAALTKYTDFIHTKYKFDDQTMVYIAGENTKMYKSISIYQSNIEENAASADNMESIIKKLNSLEVGVSSLPKDFDTSVDCTDISKNQQEPQCLLKGYQRTFSRLAPNLVGEEQILQSQDLISQYQEALNNLTNPVDGLIAECEKEKKTPDFVGDPTERRPYPSNLLTIPNDGGNKSTYAPEVCYGDAYGNPSPWACTLKWTPINWNGFGLVNITYQHALLPPGKTFQDVLNGTVSMEGTTGPGDGLEDFFGIY